MVSIRTVLGLGAFVLFAYACSDSSDPGARVVSGLERAQCDAKLFRADSDTCLQSFVTCRASNDATTCLLYTSPSPRDRTRSRMPSSA